MPNNLTQHVANEMHFITKEGALKVRTVNNLPDTIVDLAKTLDARWLVMACDWDTVQRCPVWSVYDMHRVSRTKPISLPMPAKTFTNESADPAVMYALAKQGGV